MDVIYLMQKEMFRRCYSPRTISTYVQCIRQFMRFCKKEPNCVTKQDIKAYIDVFSAKREAGNTINVHLNALKFMFEEILNKKLTVKIRYSKTPKTLPVFLTKEEVIGLFKAVENEKHLLILEIIYSAGLRVSEVVNLKKCDFDFERRIGWVRKGKGMKDRPFIIARALESKLKAYVGKNCQASAGYLFPGANGRTLHIRTVQEIVKHAAIKSGIKKNVHPHSLRHSFATHLIENGYDVAAVQPLLGHNSAETTMVYIHMANPKMISVKSPYDDLAKNNGQQEKEAEK